MYCGSLASVQLTEAEFPARAELAPAPKVVTEVWAVVLEVCVPLQAVPGAAAVQVYVSVSVPFGGVATEGPFAGEKSVVTFNVILPVPVDCVVRILYVRLVLPVNAAKIPPEVVSVVVAVFTASEASAPTVTLIDVVPVVLNDWA